MGIFSSSIFSLSKHERSYEKLSCHIFPSSIFSLSKHESSYESSHILSHISTFSSSYFNSSAELTSGLKSLSKIERSYEKLSCHIFPSSIFPFSKPESSYESSHILS